MFVCTFFLLLLLLLLLFTHIHFVFNQQSCSQPLCPDALPDASAGVGGYILVHKELGIPKRSKDDHLASPVTMSIAGLVPGRMSLRVRLWPLALWARPGRSQTGDGEIHGRTTMEELTKVKMLIMETGKKVMGIICADVFTFDDCLYTI